MFGNTIIYYEGKVFFQLKEARRYYISRCGSVLSTIRKPELVGGGIQSKGYQQVVLYRNDGTKWPALVHRLVATAFLTPISGKDQVNHKDGNRLNNHVHNLEWVNNRENSSHARTLKLTRMGQRRFAFWFI